MKRFIQRGLSLILSLLLVSAAIPAASAAQDGRKAKRTVLFYCCGSDLETESGLASFNLKQVLSANFSADDDVRFIVMTGGSLLWNMESSYLCDPNGVGISTDPETGEYTISNEYNQIWEAMGADAKENAGKLVLLDADGVTGAEGEAVAAEDEMMGDYRTLQAFINYGAANYPAEKYDLILWDHGAGPMGQFAVDQHNDPFWGDDMQFKDIVHALSDNLVVDQDRNGVAESKFDFVNFDACLMGSVEMALAYSAYADYYICSADYVPGYGEYYTGWLDMLGAQPDCSAYALGKKMVDDFYDFYTEGDYAGQDGTLAVLDLSKLVAPETGFLPALDELRVLLEEQTNTFGADGSMQIFDEYLSARNSVKYGDNNYYDVKTFAALLGIVASEVSEANLHSDSFDSTNVYTEVSQKLQRVLSQDDWFYSKVTKHEETGNVIYRTPDGGFSYGKLSACGLYLYYPVPDDDVVFAYDDRISDALEYMADGVAKTFLINYKTSLLNYGYIQETSDAINALLTYEGADKSEIDYDRVMAYWKANHENDPALEKYTYWNLSLAKKIARRPGGMTPEFEQWLARVIDAQVKDFILPENVTANRVITGADDAYELTVSDSSKRAIQSVERNIYAELPAVEAYKELVDAEQRADIEDFGNLRVGKVYGDLSWPMPYPTDLTDLDYLKRVIGWYNEPESTWNVPSFEQKWYAVNDAEGNRHVASIYSIKDNSIIIPAFYGESETDQHPIYLKFEKENPGDTFGKLIVVFFVDDDGAIRGTFAENLTRDLKVWTMVSGSRFMQDPVYIPITENAFVINKDNCGDISISYTDIAQISDIRDVDDDDSAFDSTVTITDVYCLELDVTDKIINPEFDVCDIRLAEVESAIAIGGDLKLNVTLYGEPLEEGVDFTWEKKAPSADLSVPGEAVITLIGHSRFTRRADKTVYVQAGLLGDADLNGRINVIDATAIQRHLAEYAPFSEMQLAAADVDGDGEVTIQDVTVLQLWLAEFECGETGIGEPVDRG